MSRATNNDSHFATSHLEADLGRRSLRGGAVTVAGQVARALLNLVSTALLARVLSPGDFGLVAMVMVVAGFVHLFRDLGLTMATVQRSVITQDEVSALFWLNVLLGAVMALLTCAAAPLIAWFYGEPRLMWATVAVSGTFVLGGLSVQHQALLTRQMRFPALSATEVASMAAGVATALITARAGAGFWALVYMQLAVAATTCVLSCVQCDWRPSRPRWAAGAGSMVAFGGHLTGFNVINYLNRNVDNLLVGRLFGASQLGLYSKAYQLLLLPLYQINGPMTRVAVPALSRLQHDPDRYRHYYHNAIQLLCAASMPAVVLLFTTADQAIPLVLGRQWAEAVFLFQLLAPAAFIGTFNVATGWVYVSLGQTDRQLRMGVGVAIVTLAAFVIGTRWGTAGVAAACSVAACVTRYPTILYCFRTTPLRPGDLFRAVWQPAVASLLAGAVVYGLRALWPMPSMHLGAAFAVNVATYGLAYLLTWQAFPRGREMLGLVARTAARPMLARRAKYQPIVTTSSAY